MPKLTKEEKKNRIAELLDVIRKANAEIDAILEPEIEQTPKKQGIIIPKGFNIQEKVLTILKEKSEGATIDKEEVKKEISARYNLNIIDDQAQGVLSNLKAADKVIIVSRGRYALK